MTTADRLVAVLREVPTFWSACPEKMVTYTHSTFSLDGLYVEYEN